MARLNSAFIVLFLIGSVYSQFTLPFANSLEAVRKIECSLECKDLTVWNFIRNRICPKICPEMYTTTPDPRKDLGLPLPGPLAPLRKRRAAYYTNPIRSTTSRYYTYDRNPTRSTTSRYTYGSYH